MGRKKGSEIALFHLKWDNSTKPENINDSCFLLMASFTSLNISGKLPAKGSTETSYMNNR